MYMPYGRQKRFLAEALSVFYFRLRDNSLYCTFINAQDSLNNLIEQNIITWGVSTDGKSEHCVCASCLPAVMRI